MSMLTALRVHRIPIPLRRPFITAVRRADALETVLVEASDSDGRSGWGEAAISWKVTGESPESVTAIVGGPMTQVLIGREVTDPDLPELIEATVWGNAAARCAVESALADLAAVTAGVSLVAALGAPNVRQVRTDMTLSMGDAEQIFQDAEPQVARGFDHLKLKVGAAHNAFAGVAAVRASVGDAVSLRVDANQAWTPAQAIRFIHACEDAGLDLEFVEQPVAAHDLDGLAMVAAACDTPIVADETVRTARDVAAVAARGAAAMVNLKLAKTGGLAEARRAAEAARAAGLGVLVGCMLEGPVAVAAAASLAAAIAPGQVHDLDAPLWLTRSPILGGPRFDQSIIELADAPGLGVIGVDLGGE